VRAGIAGKLDMIRDSDHVFEMILEEQTKVRGVWTGGEMTRLSELFGQEVLVEGQAVFRVSGRLLRIEAEAIKPATPADEFFRKVPAPALRPPRQRSFLEPQTAGGGAAAVHGRWPGNESEEEILAALKEMG
jgi:hypothetical protein